MMLIEFYCFLGVAKIGYVLSPPYVIVDGKTNEKFGIYPDIIHDLAKRLNFTFDFVPSYDGKYGNLEANGSWNGLIQMILNKDIDFSMSLLSPTHDR